MSSSALSHFWFPIDYFNSLEILQKVNASLNTGQKVSEYDQEMPSLNLEVIRNKYGHIAYQIQGNETCSNMIANICPEPPPPPPNPDPGGGVKT